MKFDVQDGLESLLATSLVQQAKIKAVSENFAVLLARLTGHPLQKVLDDLTESGRMHHQRLLEELELSNPELATRLDKRTKEQMPNF